MKQDVSLAICGHAWHGKSTLLGKAVSEMGMASKRQLEEARKRAKEGRDASFVFALLVFRSKDVTVEHSEAAKGITILPSIVRFEFDDHRVTVIDTPGQEQYTNNRFFGMFQADCALFVVDAEEGLKPVSHQVLRILRGFEIPVRGVSITKMDKVDYAEEAFEERVEEVRLAFMEHGIDGEDAVFFPSSAYARDRDLMDDGEGVTAYERIDWFDGPTFESFMEDLTFRSLRPTDGPLRLAIHGSEVYDHVPGVGKAATALVETGTVEPDMEIRFEPLSAEHGEPVTARIRSLELTRGHVATPGVPIEKGVPRQLVGIALKNVSEKAPLRDLFKGHGVIAGTTDAPPGVTSKMVLEMTVFDPDTLLKTGEEWTMHAHVDRVPLRIDAIVAKREMESSDWVEGEWEMLAPGEWGRIRASTVFRPVALEEAGTLAPLSTVVFREGNKAVAYGRCVRVLD